VILQDETAQFIKGKKLEEKAYSYGEGRGRISEFEREKAPIKQTRGDNSRRTSTPRLTAGKHCLGKKSANDKSRQKI